MRIASFLAVVLLNFAGASAYAEDKIDCDKANSTADLNACSEQQLAKADDELNAVYGKVIKHIIENAGEKPYDEKSWREALKNSQRAWMAFRDADCKELIPMSWTGGTGTTGEVLGCMIEATVARTKDLQNRFEIK